MTRSTTTSLQISTAAATPRVSSQHSIASHQQRETQPTRADSARKRFDALKARWWPSMRCHIEEVLRGTSGELSTLLRMADYQLDTDGKRLRALVPIRLAQAFRVDPRRLLPFAAACELIHNASLVHDDIQDGDTVRRGQPAVWKVFGMAQAMNLGSAFLYQAVQLIDGLEATPERRQEILRRVLKATLSVIEGQCQELSLRARLDVGFDQYLAMVGLKTASFLVLPMCGSARLCGASKELEQGLTEAANYLGTLYQIQDDIVDLWGDKGRGCRGNDLREGKPSALVAHCLEQSSPADGEWLRQVLRKPRELTTTEEVDEAIELFERCGSLDFVLDEVIRLSDAAVSVPALTGHPDLLQVVQEMKILIQSTIAGPLALRDRLPSAQPAMDEDATRSRGGAHNLVNLHPSSRRH